MFIALIIFLQISIASIYQDDMEVKVMYYSIIGKTATGELTTEIEEPFVAVSRDLLPLFPMNSSVLIYDCSWEGVYRIKDTMGKNNIKTFDVFTLTPHAKTEKCKCKKIE